MGHLGSGQGVYGRLQKRLDRYPIGAPPAPALHEILRRLYSEEEAEIACWMPIRFTDIRGIALNDCVLQSRLTAGRFARVSDPSTIPRLPYSTLLVY
ncbi:MAG: hypothetical protein WCF31_10690 [Candidatus Deferrimicrobiaceae bacterium]